MEKSFEERVAEAKSEVNAVSPQEAKARTAVYPNILFIDPRSPEDISSTTGIIPGAMNVTLDELAENTDSELPNKLGDYTRQIITACQGGPMGALAAYALKRRGFKNVAFIENGTQGWLDAGYETV